MEIDAKIKMMGIPENGAACGLSKAPCYLPCTKCGSDDIHRRFCKKGQDTNPISSPKTGVDSTEFVDRSSDWVQPAIKDCIVHYCRCCGYEWDGEALSR